MKTDFIFAMGIKKCYAFMQEIMQISIFVQLLGDVVAGVKELGMSSAILYLLKILVCFLQYCLL